MGIMLVFGVGGISDWLVEDAILGKGPGVAGAESSYRELWFVGGVGKKPRRFAVRRIELWRKNLEEYS